jgi:hypothetical protein
LALSASVLLASVQAQAAAPDPGVPSAVRPHCISQNPGRLALASDQVARIDALLSAQPDGPARRAAIQDVLTETQKMVYRNTAGIAAC